MARKICKGCDYSEFDFLLFKPKLRSFDSQDAAWSDIGVRITIKSCLKQKC